MTKKPDQFDFTDRQEWSQLNAAINVFMRFFWTALTFAAGVAIIALFAYVIVKAVLGLVA